MPKNRGYFDPSLNHGAEDISPVPKHPIASQAHNGGSNKGARGYGSKLKGRSMTGGPAPTAISNGTRQEDNPS